MNEAIMHGSRILPCHCRSACHLTDWSTNNDAGTERSIVDDKLYCSDLVASYLAFRPTCRMFIAAMTVQTRCFTLVVCFISLFIGEPTLRAASVEEPVREQRVSPETWAREQSRLCRNAIDEAERLLPVKKGLLLAISRVESGRPIQIEANSPAQSLEPWPWTINADGQGYFFDSKAAAVAWAKQALAQKRVQFMDIGCMQVDLQMHPAAFKTVEDAFDPHTNVTYAARFLTALHDGPANSDWGLAAGLYHSSTPALAADYRNRVAAVGAGVVSTVIAFPPTFLSAKRAGTLHMALTGGGSLAINVRRQPASTHRRQSPCAVARMLGPYLPRRPRGC
ncbi:Transglycosylase SLT family protein [Granulibacter bethesdensis]|uniref:Transglycosylase SLT family protein n=1 Tax=Granulibacter bethesdensis TaxID=364410 RepID=A0AAN0RCN2_9PROT|nr:Transglycosylase SLT family protein [Granulibacter bethesdensis]